MKIVAYYHEETDKNGVTRKSVGLEKRETVVDEPLVLERDALARIGELETENENLSAAVRVSQKTAVAISTELRAELAALKAQYLSASPDHVHPSELGKLRVALAMKNCLISDAIKAQEPVAFRYKERQDDLRSSWLYVKSRKHIVCGVPFQSLYAAPVVSAEQKGVQAVVQVCKLGRFGAAFDAADTKYAYTYTDQPDNVGAMKLGRAASVNGTKRHGDEIDRGLHLLLQLQAEGFGVFQIATPALSTTEGQGDE